jgi:hypothetical protein
MTDRGSLEFADEARFLEARLRGWADQAVSKTPGAAVVAGLVRAYPRSSRPRWLPEIPRRAVWLGLAAALLLAAVATIVVAPMGHRPLVNNVQPSAPPSERPLLVIAHGRALVVDVGLAQSTELLTGPAAHLSPDGSMVSFIATEGVGVMAADGTGRRTLADTRTCHLGPWSPDGQRVLTGCLVGDLEPAEFMVRDVAPGRPALPLEGLREFKDFGFGSWSPDGSRLVLPVEGTSLVVTSSGEASDSRRIVDSGAPWLPRWSPDGGLIAYAARAIHVIRPDGTGDRVLVKAVTPCEMRWSPDSRSLAFTAPSGGCPAGSASSDARIVDLDGAVRTIASPVPGHEVIDLAWSSDGSRLALVVGPSLHCSSDTDYSLWVVNADASNPRKVVDSVDCVWPEQGGPDW